MPAVTVADVLALPRIVTPAIGSARPVLGIVQAVRALEGAGFEVWRGFAGLDLRALIDAPLELQPGRAELIRERARAWAGVGEKAKSEADWAEFRRRSPNFARKPEL